MAATFSIALAHRRRPVIPAVVKIVAGLIGIAVAVAVTLLYFDLAPTSRSEVLLTGTVVVAVGAVSAAGWVLLDGVTDLIARHKLRALPRRALRLDAEGLEFQPDQADPLALTVPWSDIVSCEWRPGFGDNVFLCFFAPDHYPTPPAGYGCDPAEDPDVIRARAYLWSMVVDPEPIPPLSRIVLIDTYAFGTPFAVNLARCGRVDRAALDAVLRHWMGQGLPSDGPDSAVSIER